MRRKIPYCATDMLKIVIPDFIKIFYIHLPDEHKKQQLMRKILYTFLVASVALLFSSCTIEVSDGYWDNGYYDENNYLRTKELCRNSWYDSYYDANGVFCEQILVFSIDRTGYELIYAYDVPGLQPAVFKYPFSWKWTSGYYNDVEIYYGRGDYSYLEGIQFFGNSMQASFNGVRVVFDRSSIW